jgi:hypothetical protein
VPHGLHSAYRPWPETNCYLDLWIELLHAMGRDPQPLLGVAVALGWEADHFTFLKPSAADLFAAAGVTMHELALWDATEAHVAAQLDRGAVPLLEVDAFFLPDTGGSAYQQRHTKTTIAIVAMDSANAWLEYFHNAGMYRLEGEDYAGVLGCGRQRHVLFPYAELVRVTGEAPSFEAMQRLARRLLVQYAASRGPGNPIARFATALPGLLVRAGGDPARIHAMCFNTTRQLGSSFGLLADHLEWLEQDGADAAWLAERAKTLQFLISRSARRGRADPAIAASLQEMSVVWERCMADIAAFTVPVRALPMAG